METKVNDQKTSQLGNWMVQEADTLSQQEADTLSQQEVDRGFFEVIVPNYELSFDTNTVGPEVSQIVEENEVPEGTTEKSEKMTWRQRVSNKLGALATEAKIAWYSGGPAGIVGTGVRAVRTRLESTKAKNEKSDTVSSKRKIALATTALAGLAAAGAYAAHKSGIDHDSILSAFNDSAAQPDFYSAGVDGAANSKIITGGMGDPTSGNLYNQLQGTYFIDDNPVRIQYPAAAAPLSGVETFDQSIEKGSDALYHAIKERLDGGYEVDVTAYSQGTVVQKEAVERIIAENGGVSPSGLTATYLAPPNLSTGLYNTPFYEAAEPLLSNFGVNPDTSPLHEGAHVYARTTDVVSNSGDRPWTTVLSQGIGYLRGDGHALTAADIADTSRHFTHTTPDGVTITSIRPEGTQTAALRAAEMNGFLVTPEADAFGQAIAPQGEVGMPNPGIDGDEVVKTGAALIDDSARRAGLANPNLTQAANDWVNHAPAPIKQTVNDTINTIFNPQSAPAPAEYVPPVVEAPAYVPPVVEAAPAPVEYVPPAVEAPAPVYVPPAPAAEQVATAINDTSAAAQQAANTWAPGNQQIQNDIQNFTDQAHGLASQFGLVG